VTRTILSVIIGPLEEEPLEDVDVIVDEELLRLVDDDPADDDTLELDEDSMDELDDSPEELDDNDDSDELTTTNPLELPATPGMHTPSRHPKLLLQSSWLLQMCRQTPSKHVHELAHWELDWHRYSRLSSDGSGHPISTSTPRSAALNARLACPKPGGPTRPPHVMQTQPITHPKTREFMAQDIPRPTRMW
jgi:hypothetical protein